MQCPAASAISVAAVAVERQSSLEQLVSGFATDRLSVQVDQNRLLVLLVLQNGGIAFSRRLTWEILATSAHVIGRNPPQRSCART